MKLFAMLFVVVGLFGQSPQRPVEWSADWWQINWEREKFEKRIPTDTIYIHHTAGQPGHTWQKLSEIGHERQYIAVYYLDPKVQKDPAVKGQVPYSGHFRMVNGVLTQVFYAYHWLIKADGMVVRLLDDREVGWHAGNWNENLRSVAIVFDGDLTKGPPSKKALKTASKLVSEYAKTFPITRLRGHFDARKTECPGPWYSQPINGGFSWYRFWSGFQDKSKLTGRERLMKLAKVKLASQ